MTIPPDRLAALEQRAQGLATKTGAVCVLEPFELAELLRTYRLFHEILEIIAIEDTQPVTRHRL